MGQELKLIIILIWLPQAIRQVLLWIYWWQVKEYRCDRFKTILFKSESKKKLELNIISLKLLMLLISAAYLKVIWILLFVFVILDFKYILEIINRNSRKPVLTQRAVLIFSTSVMFIILTAVSIWFGNTGAIAILIFGELLLILSITFGILWTNIVMRVVKQKQIIMAQEWLKKTKPTVIGITGSYGKTTTKEFAAHLLSQAHDTKKTVGSENTEMGIAKRTLKAVNKNTRYYVVEMGAYKKGEIENIAKIVNPEIGIITGIEPQHLSLFGNLEQIKKTKYELIKALPSDGTAIFNLSNKYCRELAEKARKDYPNLRVLGYSLAKKGRLSINSTMDSRIIAADTDGVIFEIRQGNIKKIFFAPVKGIHFIENLTGAILLAKILGLTWAQIEKGCRTLKLTEKIMQTIKIKKNVYVIDDTYNATPKGFESAIEYTALFEGKTKIVVTPGIIELGSLSSKIHTELGKQMKDMVDRIMLTQGDFAVGIRQGLGTDKAKLEVFDDSRELTRRVEQVIENGQAVVLLEGRIPASLSKMIERKKNV